MKYRFALSRDGIIAYDRDTPATIRFDREESKELAKRDFDFDKMDYYCEVAHLEISNDCNMQCSYCYTGAKTRAELSTLEWRMIIDNLAKGGLFQVSFGGGEPTLREDLILLAKHVKEVGLNLGMTTNGTTLPEMSGEKQRSLKAFFNQINISWHENAKVVERALRVLKDFEIPAGINYTFSRSMQKDNETVKALAKEYNAEILYLVYKPVKGDFKEQIDPEVVRIIAQKAANDHLKVAVDGPCVNQCLMKRKFIDVDSLGNVYPCSFVRKPLGNLLKTDFSEIWKARGEQDECPFVKFKKDKVS
jgi:MoaA/NifB/PqqE/SkfB family radical SAM enzyme